MSADDLHGEKVRAYLFAEFSRMAGGNRRMSVAFTTYQAGKLFLLGVKPDGRLSVFERTFARSMGLAVSGDGRSLALATQYQIHRFDNVLPAGQVSPDGFDAVYAPHAGWVTGDVDAHDVGFASDGRPLFVNTKFSCLATVSDGHSFKPIWTPSFISRLGAEDRCHLNGLALEDGRPRYVTAVSRSDAADGWRDRRADGGIVIDVESNEIVVEGLSMPHSPRLHDGRLWLLNSGAGEFGFVDLQSGRFEAVAFCPGICARPGISSAGMRSLGFRCRAKTARFPGCHSTLPCRRVTPILAAALQSSISTTATWSPGSASRESCANFTMSRCCRMSRPSLIGFKTDEVRYVLSIDQ